jgi:hypothetical protein
MRERANPSPEKCCPDIPGAAITWPQNAPWVLSSKEDLERIFTEQLRKCRVEHFDFYLLHNIGGKTYDAVLEYDVYEFLRKKKEAATSVIWDSPYTTPPLMSRGSSTKGSGISVSCR